MRGMMKVIAVLAVCIVLSLCDAEPHPANHHARKNHAGKGVAKGKGAAPKAVIPKLALKGAEKAHKKGKQQAHKVVAPKVDAGVLNKIMVELEEMTKSLPALQGQAAGLEEKLTEEMEVAAAADLITNAVDDCTKKQKEAPAPDLGCGTLSAEMHAGLSAHMADEKVPFFTATGLANFGKPDDPNAGKHLKDAIEASSDLAGALGALAGGTAALAA